MLLLYHTLQLTSTTYLLATSNSRGWYNNNNNNIKERRKRQRGNRHTGRSSLTSIVQHNTDHHSSPTSNMMTQEKQDEVNSQQESTSPKQYHSMMNQLQVTGRKEYVNWMIRSATIHDRDGCAALIQLSYSALLVNDYSTECLQKCLPLITIPRQQLLTCNTWYVVEHPSTRQIVGCGGWTVRTTTKPKQQQQQQQEEGNVTAEGSNNTATKTTIMDPTLIEDIPHIRHFATHPHYVRCGIASTIWKRIYDDISQYYNNNNTEDDNTTTTTTTTTSKKFPTLEVFSTLTAQSFYESCGFIVVQRMDMTLNQETGAIFPVLLMRRESITL